jgi:phage shock protein PspC (stress-responsive transcriptional regulator)
MTTNDSPTPPGTGPGSAAPGPVGAPPSPPGAPGEEFFDRIRAFGAFRPDQDRWAAGVCAGLARRWGLDPLLMRGLFVAFGIVTGIGVGVYGLLWLFMPQQDGRIHAQQVLRGEVTAGFVGSVLFVLSGLPLHNGIWGNSGTSFGGLTFLALLGFGIWWLVTRRGHGSGRPAGTPGDSATDYGTAGYGSPEYGTPGAPARPGGPETETGGYPSAAPPAVPGTAGGPGYGYGPASGSATTVLVAQPRPVDPTAPSHALTLTTVGLATLAATLVIGWDRFIGDVPGSAAAVAAAVALAVIALGVVLAGLVGRRSGGLAPIAILVALVAGLSAASHDALTSTNVRAAWTPTTQAAATQGYSIGSGRAVLDLTSPQLVAGLKPGDTPVTIPAEIGAGELVVIVPRGVGTEVDASVGLGSIDDKVDGHGQRGGPGMSETITSGTNPVLVIQAKVGFGQIQVVNEGTEVAR